MTDHGQCPTCGSQLGVADRIAAWRCSDCAVISLAVPRVWKDSLHAIDGCAGTFEPITLVPDASLDEMRHAAERATALAERYGEAIVAISEALPGTPRKDLNRVRVVLAGLDLPAAASAAGARSETAEKNQNLPRATARRSDA